MRALVLVVLVACGAERAPAAAADVAPAPMPCVADAGVLPCVCANGATCDTASTRDTCLATGRCLP